MNFTAEGYVTQHQVETMTMGERIGVLNKAESPINSIPLRIIEPYWDSFSG
jgi:hypothetical protein